MKHSSALGFLSEAIAKLEAQGLLRTPPPAADDLADGFCSNDYLGLARSLPHTADAALGATASRLVCGTFRAHEDLERALAAMLGLPAALAFTSGYAANVGLVTALVQPGDQVVSDALVHASLIDGIRLTKAEVDVVPHLDVEATRRALRRPVAGRRWVITESYFSMDADSPDLRALRAVCDEAGAALLVDEAHALGVLGPGGRGLCAEAGITADAVTATLGKAFGASGAVVAGSEELRLWLWNRARSFVFSTGMSPKLAADAAAAVGVVRSADDLRASVMARAAQLRAGLTAMGAPAIGHGPIVPVVLGDSGRAVRVARALGRRGVFVQPIRPPSVPAGTARLRLTVTAGHTAAQVDVLVGALRESLAEAS